MLSLFAMIYLKGEFRFFFCATTDFHRPSSPPMQPFYHSPFHLDIKKISSVSRTVYEGTHKLRSVFIKNKASRVFFPRNKSLNLKNSFTDETLNQIKAYAHKNVTLFKPHCIKYASIL